MLDERETRLWDERGKELTGYVLGEELGTLSASSRCLGVPQGFDEDVMVFTRYDSNIASCGMAYFAVVA